MALPDEDGRSLAELYAQGAQVSSDVESSSGRQDDNNRLNAIHLLTLCDQRIESLALFSLNEEEEDISTGDLKYLLAPYHLGVLLTATPENDPSLRKESLIQAKQAFARFLRLCKAYKLVPKSALVEEDQDPHTRRAMKIQRHKDLTTSRAALFAMQAMAIRKKRIQSAGRELEADESFEDDGNERDIWRKQITVAVVQATEQQDHLAKEIELLSYAAGLPQSEREKPLQPPPTDVLEKLHSAAANLGSQREKVAADVFKPGHRLPTRTLREQADIEIAQARSTAERQAKAEKHKKELETDEDYVLAKERAWDDWKDDHQRGEGNSRSRPTA